MHVNCRIFSYFSYINAVDFSNGCDGVSKFLTANLEVEEKARIPKAPLPIPNITGFLLTDIKIGELYSDDVCM